MKDSSYLKMVAEEWRLFRDGIPLGSSPTVRRLILDSWRRSRDALGVRDPIASVLPLRGDELTSKIEAGETFTIYDEDDRYKFKTFEAGAYEAKPLQHLVMSNGRRCVPVHSLAEKKEYYNNTLNLFSPSERRLINPHYYKVDISDQLYDLKMEIINRLVSEINNFNLR